MKTISSDLTINRNFVSEIDVFLAHFDKCHPKKSVSQEQEIAQYQALMALRDTKTNSQSSPTE